MWISFLIPKIEDGNNFGVSIQEETLGEIRTVESEAASFFDQISRYYMTRAKLVSKVGHCLDSEVPAPVIFLCKIFLCTYLFTLL